VGEDVEAVKQMPVEPPPPPPPAARFAVLNELADPVPPGAPLESPAPAAPPLAVVAEQQLDPLAVLPAPPPHPRMTATAPVVVVNGMVAVVCADAPPAPPAVPPPLPPPPPLAPVMVTVADRAPFGGVA